MTIKADNAGSLSFTEIAAEWGGSQPHSLDEYHAGESLVFAGAADGSGNAIPSSGTISFSNFYDTTYFQTTSISNVTGNVTVPSGANAIYIAEMSGGGGGGFQGAGYDKAGGEGGGPGGGGGGYVNQVYLTVVAGETLTFTRGSGGSGGVHSGASSFNYVGTAASGTSTTITGSSSSSVLTLTGGSGASVSGGFVQGPLRSQTAGSGGTVNLHSKQVTSGTTTSGVSVSSGTTRSGVANGVDPGHCSGDNCSIGGGNGGSANGSNGGGSGGSAGNAGSAGFNGGGGGGGGSAGSIGLGGAGATGIFTGYAFVRIL